MVPFYPVQLLPQVGCRSRTRACRASAAARLHAAGAARVCVTCVHVFTRLKLLRTLEMKRIALSGRTSEPSPLFLPLFQTSKP